MTNQAALNKMHTPGFAELCAHCELRLVVLLDPSAKGQAAPCSDINLAVLLPAELKGSGGGDHSLASLELMRHFATYLETSGLHLVPLDLADCVLRFDVARAGRPIFEARSGAFGDFCSLAVREHEDSLMRIARLTRDSAAKGGV